jgi:GNAT superfamily N-acetyltransferase
VKVRAASEADLDALVDLNQVVQNLHAALYPGDFKQVADPSAVRTFFAARLAGSKSAIGITEADRVPVGYVWFEVQVRPETPFTLPRPRIYVHHISVAPGARRRGIAAALMRYVPRKGSDDVEIVAVDRRLVRAPFWRGGIFAAHASDLQQSPDTARLIDMIEKRRGDVTQADLKAAHHLKADGDRAYRRKNYPAAFTAYYSYPNAPTAYAYVMAGDAHWRSVLPHRTQEAAHADGGPVCRLDNSHFAHDLATHVAQHQAVGLALAARDNDRRFLKSTLYRRAQESTACLQDLAQRYQSEAPTACVDLDGPRRCLGAPLIK